MDLVYINGDYFPKEEATISVFDRGFLFSDSVYDMVPVLNGQFFTAHEHIQRLIHSANAIRIRSPFTEAEWLSLCESFLKKNGADKTYNGSIYIHVTRGNHGERKHRPPENLTPTVVMFWIPLPKEDPLIEGITAITVEDRRRQNCSYKGTSLLPNILACYEAQEQSCYEAIQVRDHWVQEGTTSNVFVVIDNEIITPPLSSSILPGITRELIIQTAAYLGTPCREEQIHENSLKQCSEIWITGSRKDIYPVISLNHKPVGDGIVGPVCKALMKAFQERKNAETRKHDRTKS